MLSLSTQTGTFRFNAAALVKTGSRWLALALMLLAAQTASALVHREVSIKAPNTASARSLVTVSLTAITDGADEQVGFFQAEYSIDNGKTWVGICYDTNSGTSARREATFTVGPSASTALVRVRVGFRNKAGDVDFAGNPINWNETWDKWLKPPAKYARIVILAQ
ncbi:MAG: hypothetical protein PSU94_08125 [Lacunisphaera sp.]|nr:hypothetical protein [Lacunisphaera sp.]